MPTMKTLLLLFLASRGWGLIPAEVQRALLDELTGELARDHVQQITMYNRVQASADKHRAAEYVLEKLRTYGIDDVRVEKYPADGKTYHLTQKSSPTWDARAGELWVVEPVKKRIVAFAEVPVSLAPFSRSTSLTAELVDVGVGTSEKDYEGKEARGKIVLASGSLNTVYSVAAFKHGAAGVISYWLRDPVQFPDVVANGRIPHESDKGEPATFGFNVSPRSGRELARLAQAGKVMAKVTVDAEVRAGEYETLIATIPGGDLPGEEVILTAHLDHYKPGANDNASGSAAILEVARALHSLINRGVLPRPRRTLRFLWIDEMNGTAGYLEKHPETKQRAVAALNFDMAGADLVKANSYLRMKLTPDSMPSFLNDLTANFLKLVDTLKIITPTGSRAQFNYRLVPFVSGSDHIWFNDGSLGIPAVQFNHWDDDFYHTSHDSAEMTDPTEFKRITFAGAGMAWFLATAGPADAIGLANEVRSNAMGRIGDAVRQSVRLFSGRENLHRRYVDAVRKLDFVVERERRAILSAGRFGNARYADDLANSLIQIQAAERAHLDAAYRQAAEQLAIRRLPVENTPEEKEADRWVVERTFRGSFNQLFLTDRLKTPEEREQAGKLKLMSVRNGAYEAVNFADGRRSLLDIAIALNAEYGYVSSNDDVLTESKFQLETSPEYARIEVQDVVAFFQTLEKAGLVRIKAR